MKFSIILKGRAQRESDISVPLGQNTFLRNSKNNGRLRKMLKIFVWPKDFLRNFEQFTNYGIERVWKFLEKFEILMIAHFYGISNKFPDNVRIKFP